MRVGKASLLCQAGCMDENISNLLWVGMQTLGELYEESMVMTSEWGSLQSDFDGRLVSWGFLSVYWELGWGGVVGRLLMDGIGEWWYDAEGACCDFPCDKT